MVWQLFSLTSESAHTLIIVVDDLIHSMWVCDAECQSFLMQPLSVSVYGWDTGTIVVEYEMY